MLKDDKRLTLRILEEKKDFPEECISREVASEHVGEENIPKAERKILKQIHTILAAEQQTIEQ